MSAFILIAEVCTKMRMRAREAGPDGTERHIERCRGLRIAQARPIGKRDDFPFLYSKPPQETQDACHLALVVKSASGVVTEIVSLELRWQFCQEPLVTAKRPVGIADDVVGHGQKPR